MIIAIALVMLLWIGSVFSLAKRRYRINLKKGRLMKPRVDKFVRFYLVGSGLMVFLWIVVMISSS